MPRAGFRSVNVDLIYGLPRQTLGGISATRSIPSCCARPDRVAIYGYAHMPQLFKAQRQIDERELPDAAQRARAAALAVERLTAAGYRYIGLDHFALPERRTQRARSTAGTLQRNFMGYTTHADCDLIGLGVSAISHVGDSFSQNYRDLPTWEVAVDQGHLPIWRGIALDDDDVMRARGDPAAHVPRRHRPRADRSALRHRLRCVLRRCARATAAARRRRPGGASTAARIVATSRGRLLLRMIAMCFDRYLRHRPYAETMPRHSRVL